MTEQSKIPLPDGKKGGSLFERAEGAFGGFGGLTPAPVPKELAAPANRRVKKPSPDASPEPAADPSPHDRGPDVAAADISSSAPGEARRDRGTAQKARRVEFTAAPRRVDRDRLEQEGLIVPGGPVTALAEEFRIVKRQVLLAARQSSLDGVPGAAQRVLISSPLPGEGKTFCATNLALSIAGEKDSEVLLVDADFAKPSVPRLLGLSSGQEKPKGLMDALADPGLRVEDYVVATDVPGLYVLPAGNRTATDSEYLASERTAEVLERLTLGASNRMVIFDSPPALAASPA